MAHGGHNVTRDAFEQNLGGKLLDARFNADIGPLLTTGFSLEFPGCNGKHSLPTDRTIAGVNWRRMKQPADIRSAPDNFLSQCI